MLGGGNHGSWIHRRGHRMGSERLRRSFGGGITLVALCLGGLLLAVVLVRSCAASGPVAAAARSPAGSKSGSGPAPAVTVEVRSVRVEFGPASSELPKLLGLLGVDRPDRAGRVHLGRSRAAELRSLMASGDAGTIRGAQRLVVRSGQSATLRVESAPRPADPTRRMLEVEAVPEIAPGGFVRLNAGVSIREADSGVEAALQDLGLGLGTAGNRATTPGVAPGESVVLWLPRGEGAWLFEIRAEAID